MKVVNRVNEPSLPVSVVLVDDHESIRDMMRVVLQQEGGYEIVGEAGDGVEGLRLCRVLRPRLVVLDLSLPGLCGTHLIRLLREEVWGARVVVYTGTADVALQREALAEQPHGFVRKEDSLRELCAALRAVAQGARHLSPWAVQLMPSHEAEVLRRLTPTERAVLQMMAEGWQTKEVAEALGASPKTVEHHRQHLRTKLGVHDSVSLARFAIRHGLAAV